MASKSGSKENYGNTHRNGDARKKNRLINELKTG
jgi:hypothetical protein